MAFCLLYPRLQGYGSLRKLAYTRDLGGGKGPDDQEPNQNFLALGDYLSVFMRRAGRMEHSVWGFPHAIAFSMKEGEMTFSYYLSVDIDILQRATIFLLQIPAV